MKISMLFSLKAILLTVLTATLWLTGCQPDDPEKEIRKRSGVLPDEPVNFGDLNTEYDDYNSTAPPSAGQTFPLTFSTNRFSKGKEFDLTNLHVYMFYDLSNHKLNAKADDFGYQYIKNNLKGVNSENNEFGPFALGNWADDNDFLMFARDEAGANLDLYLAQYNSYPYKSFIPFADRKPYKFSAAFNTAANEGYPTLFNNGQPLNFVSDITTQGELFFTSDRSGNFDLYRTRIPANVDLFSWLKETPSAQIENMSGLNSPKDDKCPYINDTTMVFTSNREGGFGGFDLWYSTFKNGAWSAPVNFGSKINTAADEYRPILIKLHKFSNQLLIFSSNRPGGKGGFDLHYVGVFGTNTPLVK